VAFPFAEMPTLGDFIEWAEMRYGIRRKDSPTLAEGPRGPVKWTYLQRNEGDPFVVLPDMADQDRLSPNEVRSFCETLGMENRWF